MKKICIQIFVILVLVSFPKTVFAEEIKELTFPQSIKNEDWNYGKILNHNPDENTLEVRLRSGEEKTYQLPQELKENFLELLIVNKHILFEAEDNKIKKIKKMEQDFETKKGENISGTLAVVLILLGVLGIWINFYKKSQKNRLQKK